MGKHEYESAAHSPEGAVRPGFLHWSSGEVKWYRRQGRRWVLFITSKPSEG